MEFYGSCHNHTDRSNFRIRDSINSLNELCWYAADELKHNFIAITDHETIATAIDCQDVEKKIREKYPNFKVIRGNEIYLCRNGLNKENYVRDEDKFYHFILLARDAIGHRQLRELSTRAWLRAFETGRMMRVPTYYQDLINIIGKEPGHVIFSQACIGSRLAQLVLDYNKEPSEDKYEYIKQWIINISNICGRENYFLEVQPSFNKEQIIVNTTYKKLSEELSIPVVISLDAHYLKKEDEPIHHAFLTAQEGERETSEFYASTYMMSREEIHSYMDKSLGEETVSLWMNNTKKIYDMCEDYDLTKPTRIVYIPKTIDTITPEEFCLYEDKIKELRYFYESKYPENRDLAAAIVRKILTDSLQYDNIETFEMIDDNLKAIRLASEKMNTQWSAYLLNLRDYVNIIWEKGNSLMGPARGSGTGFLLLNMLGVTQINPLKETTKTYSFRFLNPERVSPLDVDLDIEGGKRPQVYKALQDAYGQDRVSKVLTIRTEKSKSALLTACFKKGTLINTINGEKPIEKITEEDYVETLNGFQKVLAPTYCLGKPSVKIKTKNSENPYFVCTPDHKILTIKKKNKHRIDGDILTSLAKEIFPELKNHKAADSIYQTYICNFRKVEPQWVEAKDIVKNVHYGLVPIDSYIEDKEYLFWENDFHQKYGIGISQNIKINEDFCELVGIWIAEGSILHNNSGIAFTVNKKEEIFKKRIIQLMWKVFQMDNFGIYERKDSLALTIQYSSRQIGNFFSQLFTGYIDVRTRPDFHRKLTQWGKRVPEVLRNIDPFLQLQIFKGWFIGDGYASLRNDASPQSKGTTVSKELAYDFIRILHRNYLNPSVDIEEHSDVRETTYNLTFYSNKARRLYEMKYHSDLSEPLMFLLEDRGDKDIPVQYNNKLYMKAKLELLENDTNLKNEEVYCLSMPEQNFCVNHLIVHNCRGLKVDPDEAAYLASFIKADRGMTRTLKQTFYGDEENDIPPDRTFQNLMTEKYSEVWKVAQKIENLCCGTGSHAGGVIFYDEDITNSSALMQTTNGDIITQFDLHTVERVGSLKIDLLSIEALDRIRATLDLLIKNGYLDKNKSLRENYEEAIGIYNIERNEPKMWSLIHQHKIESLFQMEQQSGIKGIAAVKPTSVDDLAALNAVIRLMVTEKGAEQPVDKFARFKKKPQLWYQEMDRYGVSKEGQKVLKKIIGISYGLCIQQEQFMILVQQPEIGGFSLLWADRLRKAISKKKPKEYDELTKEFFKQTEERGCEKALCNYVWNVLIAMNRGYGFKMIETLYSNIQKKIV